MKPKKAMVKRIATITPIATRNTPFTTQLANGESMPYNIELMDKPLEEYIQKKQKIRITGGVFQGKEGCIMRIHRNTKLVFAFGNMTVAISYLQAFPFEKVE